MLHGITEFDLLNSKETDLPLYPELSEIGFPAGFNLSPISADLSVEGFEHLAQLALALCPSELHRDVMNWTMLSMGLRNPLRLHFTDIVENFYQMAFRSGLETSSVIYFSLNSLYLMEYEIDEVDRWVDLVGSAGSKIATLEILYSYFEGDLKAAVGVISHVYNNDPSKVELLSVLAQIALLSGGPDVSISVVGKGEFDGSSSQFALYLLRLAQGQWSDDGVNEFAEEFCNFNYPIGDLIRGAFVALKEETVESYRAEKCMLAMLKCAPKLDWRLKGEGVDTARVFWRQRVAGLEDTGRWRELGLPSGLRELL